MRLKIKEKIQSLGENNRIVLLNIIGAFLVKGGALFISLFTMPAYIAFFKNQTVLGIWYTILSVINWILYFDLGIGNGLRNHLTKTITKHDDEESKKYISSAYVSLGAISLVLLVIVTILAFTVNWNSLLSIDSSYISSRAMTISMIIVFAGIIFQLFLRNISSILYAIQKSSVNNFLSLCTSVITLVLVLIIPSGSNDKNMIIMAIIHSLAVVVPLLATTFILFFGKMRKYAPSIRYYDKEHSKGVLTLGGKFLLAQLTYMLIMSTNEILITKISGSEYVVEYQAYYKIFSLMSTIFTLMLTPLWSAITKAISEKQNHWVSSIYKKISIIAGICCFFELLLVAVIKPIIRIWLKDSFTFEVNYLSALLLASVGCLMMLNGVLSSISNGIGRLKEQVICFSIGAFLKIPLSILLVKLFNSWNGIIFANLVSMGIYTLVQPIILKNKKFI